MSHFDKLFSNEIPLSEAASFFVSVRRPLSYVVDEQVKTASSHMKSAAQQVIADLLSDKMPEGKAGKYKLAFDHLTDENVAQLKEVGKGRAISSLAAEAQRERGRRGERVGGTVGALGGAAAGAAAGRKYLKGTLGTLGGAALGASLGRGVGKEVGTEVDIRKNASAKTLQGIYGGDLATATKARDALVAQGGKPEDIAAHNEYIQSRTKMAMAFRKLAYGEELAAAQQGQSATTQPTEAPQPAPQVAPAQGAPPTPPQLPVHYMGAEVAGREAQTANEAAYYRARMAEAVASSAQLQQALQQSQEQMTQMQEQMSQSAQQIEGATQEAVMANERALQTRLEASNLAIGAQKMRERIMELASQDPAQVQQNEQMQSQMQQQMAGTPEMSGEATAPGSVPAETNQGGGAAAPADSAPTASTAEPKSEAKTASMSPYLLSALVASGGAAHGAASAHHMGKNAPEYRERAESLGKPSSFPEAIEAAKAKHDAEMAEIAEQYPKEMMARSALHGAGKGLMISPSVDKGLQQINRILGRG